MIQNTTLCDIRTHVLNRQLGKAINTLENYLLAHPRQQDMDQLISIRNDYQLLTSYWERGFDDPQREQLYDQLLRRMYALNANIHCYWQLTESAFLKAIHLRPRKIRKDWSMSAVKESMEAFVSNVALLELEPEHTRQQKSDNLYHQHWELMRDLFDYIFTSRQWRDSLADAFLDMLLSPTLASIDQQLIVSAITLSAMQHFCIQKFRVLCEVYRNATDEPLRQRALVGWVFTANSEAALLYSEMQQMVATMCNDPRTQSELTELQMQLIYCLQADADRDTIQKEILPDIMNGSKMKMTRGGLIEMDEDTLDDILHPEASELAVERMEQSMKRMVDMQKEGADIYFGGFSQMKRFPFFNDISNWLVPFYPQHPGISQTWNNNRGGKFLKTITKVGAFCDSDKYSFVLAFNQVLSRLPQNILKMVERGEASAMPIGGEMSMDEQQSPAFIRRSYLQNLYRFYRLYPTRSEFCNPFADHIFGDGNDQLLLFFANKLLAIDTMAQPSLTVAKFLMKRQYYTQALKVLENIPKSQHDLQYFLMMGATLQHLPQTTQHSAAECFHQALLLQPNNERAKAGLARAYFGNQKYDEALDAYQALLAQKPDHHTYQLNTAVCLLNLGRCEEALKMLYKLNYLNPDDLTVNRVMAWALTINNKYEQADKLYCQLLAIKQPSFSDMLNYGYCLWFSRNIDTAIGMFRQFLSSQTDESFNIEKEFMQTEHQLLTSHNISDTEIQLMLDVITL